MPSPRLARVRALAALAVLAAIGFVTEAAKRWM
jgi:hypothetical protein